MIHFLSTFFLILTYFVVTVFGFQSIQNNLMGIFRHHYDLKFTVPIFQTHSDSNEDLKNTVTSMPKSKSLVKKTKKTVKSDKLEILSPRDLFKFNDEHGEYDVPIINEPMW